MHFPDEAGDVARSTRSPRLSRRTMLAATAALAGGLVGPGGRSVADAAERGSVGDAPSTAVRRARPRVILNDDGSNFLVSWDELGPEDLRAYLARLAGTQVDMVAYCVAFGGYVTYYQSAVGDPIGEGYDFGDQVKQRRLCTNRQRFQRETGDYIGFVFKTLREMGLPAVASIRMNDAHMSSDPKGPLAGRFWKSHPEWRLGAAYRYYGSCLDYAQPDVRAYLRRLVQEVVAKFPEIDGIELDGLRSPFFFKPGTGRANATRMTDLVREIRGDLDQAAKAGGRPRYLLRLNVPRTPELALDVGMDVAAWDRERLVDGVSPGCYNTDFQPAAERWKRLLGDRMPVHAYVNCSPTTACYCSLEQYRAAAANAYGAGADGVYLFNYPCLDELSRLLPCPVDRPPMPPPDFPAQCWHADLTRSRQALHELGDPAGLAHKDKHYQFYLPVADYPHFTQERASIDRGEPKPAELSFRCYDAAGAKSVRLQIKTVKVTTRDQFRLALNGRKLTTDRVRRLHAASGRDARIHSIKLDPYSQYVVTLAPDLLRSGENRLTVSLSNADPGLRGSIDLVELELVVQY